jgi:hypothetical protein
MQIPSICDHHLRLQKVRRLGVFALLVALLAGKKSETPYATAWWIAIFIAGKFAPELKPLLPVWQMV